MNYNCDHCGLEVDATVEPQALTRDPALVICDMCAATPDSVLARLPDLIPSAGVQ